MEISINFPGGNIEVIEIQDNEVFVEREIRGDKGYFYWAFCVKGAGGKTVRFRFPQDTRVGCFGAAVSLDLKKWFWSRSREIIDGKHAFTYSFSENENCVYFAHNMVYSEEMMVDFTLNNGLDLALFAKTHKGRNVPCFEIGDGEKMVVITSRHHSCESTGTYVLQGFAEACLKKRPEGIKFLFVPFVDFDGVVDGDAGKGRLPHDHNRDYGDTILYNETEKLRKLAESGNVMINFDFHSPHHDGWINDYPYLMKFSSEDNHIYNELSQKLRNFTQADDDSMTYTGEQDIEYGAKWNETTTAHNRNYFLPRTSMKASILMEIPYFGLIDNPFTQERAIKLGCHVYNAVYDLLSDQIKKY